MSDQLAAGPTPEFADVIRVLESGSSAADPRTDVDSASLVARYPELGSVVVRDLSIPARHGDIPARLYLPETSPKGALVWAHGGSFIGGNLDMPEANWVALAVAARGFAVLSVEYTKALHGVRFPVPSLDLLDAWNWAVDNLGVNIATMHLGGASAGGNLATGVGVRLRDGQGKPPASLVLAYPLLHNLLPRGSDDARSAAETLDANDRFPQSLVDQIAANYLGTEQNPNDPYAYPAYADLTGMPPMFILNSERDEHRYSGEEFAKQAMDAGVAVSVVYEPGSRHGHLDRPHAREAQQSIARIAHWLDGFPTPTPLEEVDALDRPRIRPEPLDLERFATPETDDRPGVRWWWQSEVAVKELTRQLHAIADAGFREVEIAFNREFWGVEKQRDALGVILSEAERLGVGVAMTLGASWPLKTPNTTKGTGLSTQELQYGSVRLPGGLSGPVRLPPPFDDVDSERPSTLVRVTAARVVHWNEPPAVVTVEDPWAPPRRTINPPLASTVLDSGSLIDLTSQLVDSTIYWEPRDDDWVVFAFWMRDCEQGVTAFLDGRAAQAATEYLDEYQIGADNFEVLGRVGTELFEDSLELNADSVFWTAEMIERFTERHGYDVTPYLPLLFAHGMCRFWVPNEEPISDFELDTGTGARVRRDYYRLLTDLYISEHLLPLQKWSAGHGLRHKSQVAYGQNLEAIRSNRDFVRAGGRAEGESLNSGDRTPIDRSNATWRFALDWQRSVVGGAHQGGATRISTELGAQFRAAYAFTLGDLRRMLAKEWAAGITKPFLHGVATQEPGAAWPTQTRFEQHIVSDSWNDTHFPEWANWLPLTDYWARGTVVLETGVARTDIAIYRDGFLTIAARGVRDVSLDATAPASLADTESLETAGFTVQFLDPIGLAEVGAVGDDGTLFPAGPAYRGLIVDERALPPEAAEAIATAAERGARIVIVGEPPSANSGFAGGSASDERVRAAMARTLREPSTVQLNRMSEAADAFIRLGLVPRVAVDTPALLSQWREAGSCRYVLAYNTLGTPASVTLALEGVGRVRELDLTSGCVLAAGHRAEGDRTIVPTRIPALGVRVFELDLSVAPEPVGDELSVAEVELAVEGWRLEVTSEEPAGPRTITLDGVGPGDWREVDALRRVSGTGRYTARVVVPDGLAGLPAVIDLGGLAGSAVVRIGDRVLGTAYVDDTVIKLGDSLLNGTLIEIEVRTALRNAVIASAITSLIGADSSVPQGLIGPVVIRVERTPDET